MSSIWKYGTLEEKRPVKGLKVFPGIRTGAGQKAMVFSLYLLVPLFFINYPMYYVDQNTFLKRSSANCKTLISRQELEKLL